MRRGGSLEISPAQEEPDLVKSWCPDVATEIDPMALKRQSYRGTGSDIPSHARAYLVSNPVFLSRRLYGRADVAIPGIPPAACLRAPAGDVGIDEAITNTGDRIGSEGPVE